MFHVNTKGYHVYDIENDKWLLESNNTNINTFDSQWLQMWLQLFVTGSVRLKFLMSGDILTVNYEQLHALFDNVSLINCIEQNANNCCHASTVAFRLDCDLGLLWYLMAIFDVLLVVHVVVILVAKAVTMKLH